MFSFVSDLFDVLSGLQPGESCNLGSLVSSSKFSMFGSFLNEDSLNMSVCSNSVLLDGCFLRVSGDMFLQLLDLPDVVVEFLVDALDHLVVVFSKLSVLKGLGVLTFACLVVFSPLSIKFSIIFSEVISCLP